MLTRIEASCIRKIVYTKGLVTSHQVSKSGVAYRILVVPRELHDIHKLKRIDTLKLLRDIAFGGRPEDALSAAAFATALEDNPISAALVVDVSTDKFDDVSEGVNRTPRDRIVARIDRILTSIVDR